MLRNRTLALVSLAFGSLALHASMTGAVQSPARPGDLDALMRPTIRTLAPERASLRRVEVNLLDRREPRSWLLHEARRSRDGALEIALVVLEPEELKGRGAVLRREGRSLRQWTFSASGRPAELPLGATLEAVLGAPLTSDDLGLLDEVEGELAILGAQRHAGTPLYEVSQELPTGLPYESIVTWLHSVDLLPVRRDYYADGGLVRRQSFDRIEITDGLPTPLRLRSADLRDGSITRIEVRDLRFEASLPDDLFVPSRLGRLLRHSAWSRLASPVEVVTERGFTEDDALPWEQAQSGSLPPS